MNVFDFDNTIYRGESGLDLFLYYLKKDPKLVRYAPKAINAVMRYKQGKVTIEDALESYAALIEDYVRKHADLERDIRDFWDKHIHKIKPLYFRLRSDNDLILSASPELELEEICKRLQIQRFIGTDFDRETMKVRYFCFRENKVKAFLQHFPNTRIAKFYTDSYNDQPMMDISDQVFLVKGNQVQQIK